VATTSPQSRQRDDKPVTGAESLTDSVMTKQLPEQTASPPDH